MLKVTWQDEKVFSLLVDYRPHIIYNPKWKILSHFAFLKLVDTPPFGFYYFKKSNMFVVLYSLQSFSMQPLAFFDMIKPRRKEYLMSQKFILPEPIFRQMKWFFIVNFSLQGSGVRAQKWYCSFRHQTFHISILQCRWRFRFENHRFCICQTLNQRVPTSFIK